MKKEILVAGATGRTGRIIVQKLIHRGINPRILVRDTAVVENLFGDKAQAYLGDVREVGSLLPAMDGVDTVISAVGAGIPVGKNCPKRVDFQGVANMVEAARQSGVRRFILISSIAVTNPKHPMNCFGKVLDYKLKGENALRDSGMDYVIIRPGGLTDTPGGGKKLIFDQGDQLTGMISRSDLAETCLCVLDCPGEMRLTFEVIESETDGRANCGDIFSSLVLDAALQRQ